MAEIEAQRLYPQRTSGNVMFVLTGENGTSTQWDLSGNGNNGTVTGATPALGPGAILPRWRTSYSTPSAAVYSPVMSLLAGYGNV